MEFITDQRELDALYGMPLETSTIKVADHVTAEYGAYIAQSPFLTLATVGPEGLDCSPRGDMPGFVRIADSHTLIMPDRRGNNRIDSLRNIVRDPRVALLFLLPGIGNALRVNGRARISADADVMRSFAVDGKAPRTVIVIAVEAVYFQCARALVRSGLWSAQSHVDPATLPTPGTILAKMSENRIGGEEYDNSWSERAKATMW
jgi:hypothetical protein